MAQLERHGDDLLLRLSWREKLSATHGDLRVPAALVREVEVVDDAFAAVHGVHYPGRGQRWTRIGNYVTLKGAKTFAVVHEETPRGLIVRLTAAEYDEIVFGCPNPEALKDQLGFE